MTWRDSLTRRPLLALAVVLPIGLALGAISARLNEFAQRTGNPWLKADFETLFQALSSMLLVFLAASLLRRAEAHKLWLAAALLVTPVMATHYEQPYRPLLVMFAEAAWFLVLLACAREKRTLGVWCIAVCAACTTGVQISSQAVKVAESERPQRPNHSLTEGVRAACVRVLAEP